MSDRVIVFALPPVPSLNHVYRNVAINRRIMTPKGKQWQSMARYLAMAAKVKQNWKTSREEKLVMELRFFWPDRRRRDTDNCIKLLSDTLEGVLYENDYWVLPRVIDWEIDREDPRVEIKIWPL